MSTTNQKNRLTNLFPANLSDVDNLFTQVFGPTSGAAGSPRWQAPASLWESEDRLHLEIDAAGVTRDGVDVTFDKGVLSVTLDRPRHEDRQYWHNERAFGAVTRSVTLPDTVDPESIEAELTDGVLSVSIAKVPEAQPRKIELK